MSIQASLLLKIYVCCIDDASPKPEYYRQLPAIFHILSMALYVESAVFLAITIPGNTKDGLRYIFVIPNMNN